MKKEYEEPQMTIKQISFADILTTSGNVNNTPAEEKDIWDEP